MARRCWLGLFFSFLTVFSLGQSISGYVYDSQNTPVPGCRIQVKFNTELNSITDSEGRYSIRLEPGVYDLIFSQIGFETQEVKVTVSSGPVTQNIWLVSQDEQLNELIVKASKRDPAYEIIKNAIDRREINQTAIPEYSCQVYIKAREDVERKVKVQIEDDKSNEDKVAEQVGAKDTTQNDQSAFAEIRLKLDYAYPNKTKEIRTAVKSYGNTRKLFFITTTDARFSIYDNLIKLKKVTETPQISPLSQTSILSYKFKLDSIGFCNEKMLYKIRVKPRKRGNATMSGYIWIQDSTFAVTRAELTLEGGNLYKYDEFSFVQEYDWCDSIWLLTGQEFTYHIKNRQEKIDGRTTARYYDYDLNPTFPKRYFGNELGVTTEEAYNRDSGYWHQIRPEPLSPEEQEYVRIKDSIQAIVTSEAYLDSIDSAFNKITVMKVLYFGVDHRERDKKMQWGIGSVADWLEPLEIAGPRFGPYAYFFKMWENRRSLYGSGNADIGFRNGDIKGGGRITYGYAPKKIASVSFQYAHYFDLINEYDAYLNYIKRSNYMETSTYMLSHYIELFNGLYLDVAGRLDDRAPIDDLKFGTWIDRVVEDNDPLAFERYQNFRMDFELAYVIGQQYMTEPNRKVVLGSKGPTVFMAFEKGFPGIFGSTVDYEYLSFGLRQTFSLGTMGTSKYSVMTGKFTKQTVVEYADLKFQRQSDRWLYSNPLWSFQLLPENYPTSDWYGAGHYIHHFNGALINFLPLVKQLKLQLVAGAGALFLPEYDDLMYQELIVGVERVNKILRRRVRLGVFYVMANSSDFGFDHQVKFSIEVLNERRNTWNF